MKRTFERTNFQLAKLSSEIHPVPCERSLKGRTIIFSTEEGALGEGGGGVVRVVKFSYANIFYMRLLLQTIFEQGS